jgi:hypothetical protein
MVKRLFLLSLMVLALCGASTVITLAGGPGSAAGYMPPPPCIPPIAGPATTSYSQVKEQIVPVPAQLRRVRVVAPYLAGVAWPRTPLPFFGNPQSYPNPIALGRYEWLVPVAEIAEEKFDIFGHDPCCKPIQVPRCVYVKANYVKPKCGPVCGPVPMGPPPPMPMKVKK